MMEMERNIPLLRRDEIVCVCVRERDALCVFGLNDDWMCCCCCRKKKKDNHNSGCLYISCLTIASSIEEQKRKNREETKIDETTHLAP